MSKQSNPYKPKAKWMDHLKSNFLRLFKRKKESCTHKYAFLSHFQQLDAFISGSLPTLNKLPRCMYIAKPTTYVVPV